MKQGSLFLKILCLSLLLFVLPSCNSPTEISNINPEDETTPVITVPAGTTPVIAAGTNSCPWVRKREFECDGVTYIAGLSSCQIQTSGKSIFCKKEYENDLQACLNDSSPETQKCHFEKIGRHLHR